MKTTALITITFTLAVIAIGEDNIKLHLGAKTPYKLVENLNLSQPNFPGCTPHKLWYLVRHGIRNPSSSHIQLLQERMPYLKDMILNGSNGLNNSDLLLLEKWKPLATGMGETKLLSSRGGEEMRELAVRIQRRFPVLLPKIYNDNYYEIQWLNTTRTRESGMSFAFGLFGRNVFEDELNPKYESSTLRDVKYCGNLQIDKIKPIVNEQLDKFGNTNFVQKAIRRMERKLGIKENLTFYDAKLMYGTCLFETALIQDGDSPWCKIFDLKTLRIFEYASDLKYYLVHGYGFQKANQIAYPLFQDMIDFHESKDGPAARLLFGRSEFILKLFSYLGMYKDEEQLTPDGIKENRKWRLGEIDPFASNFACVTYLCNGELKLLLLLQEKIVRMPCCPDSDLCSLSKVVKSYEKLNETCPQ